MSIIKNKDAFLVYRKKAEELRGKIRNGSYESGSALHEDLYPYILCKYSLWGDETDVYDLNELAQLSVAKTIKLTSEEAVRKDSSASCEGTTSAMKKKVLLLINMQKELDFAFPAGSTGKLTDTKKIADAVGEILFCGK